MAINYGSSRKCLLQVGKPTIDVYVHHCGTLVLRFPELPRLHWFRTYGHEQNHGSTFALHSSSGLADTTFLLATCHSKAAVQRHW
jgi:hypothetical protein